MVAKRINISRIFIIYIIYFYSMSTENIVCLILSYIQHVFLFLLPFYVSCLCSVFFFFLALQGNLISMLDTSACETGTHSVSIQYIIDVTSTKMIEYNHVFTKIMIFFPMLVLYVLRRRRETRFSFVLYPLWSFRVCLERQISDIRCVRND